MRRIKLDPPPETGVLGPKGFWGPLRDRVVRLFFDPPYAGLSREAWEALHDFPKDIADVIRLATYKAVPPGAPFDRQLVAFLGMALRDREQLSRKLDQEYEDRFRADAQFCAEYVRFWAVVEMALYPWKRQKNTKTYQELYDVTRLCCGDYLPGHNFVLGDRRTYGREHLVCDKSSPPMLELLAAARHECMRADPFKDVEARARALYDIVRRKMPLVEPLVPGGVTVSLSRFLTEGGCCRHRAAVLACMLQEANMVCRYRRGRVIGRHHSFVEVKCRPGENFELLIDPTFGMFVVVPDPSEAFPGWYPDPHVNVVWRARTPFTGRLR